MVLFVSPVDGNKFTSDTQPIDLGISIEASAYYTSIAGNLFGYDRFNSLSPIGVFIQDAGQNTIIGIDPTTTAHPLASNQKNTFTHASNCSIVYLTTQLFGLSTVMSNLFGYDQSGDVLLNQYPYPCVLNVLSVSFVDIESNWISCGTLRLGSTSALVYNNYFGYPTYGDTTPSIGTDSITCNQRRAFIESSGRTSIGYPYSNSIDEPWTNYFIGGDLDSMIYLDGVIGSFSIIQFVVLLLPRRWA